MAEHFGVYGLWRQHGLVVCVRKSRGPYTGQLDLPGGTPEPDETPQQTLRRELLEECGVHLEAHGPWSPFTLQIHRTSTGQSIDLRHRGLLAAVSVLDDVAAVQNVEDVAAVEPCDPQDCDPGELSPLLRHALSIERDLLRRRRAGHTTSSAVSCSGLVAVATGYQSSTRSTSLLRSVMTRQP